MSKKNFKDFMMLFLKNIWVKQVLLAFLAVIVLSTLVLYGLDYYTHHGKAIETPDVQGMRLETAIDRIERAGLRVEVVDSVTIRGKVPGTVVDQTPRAGWKVKPNRLIFITVNSYSKKLVAAPDVRQMSLRQAQSTLQALGFGVRVTEANSVYAGEVIDLLYGSMSVSPNQKLPDEAVLTIVVGNGLGIAVDSLETDSLNIEYEN